MAIIYSYPRLTSLQNKDLLLISDVSSKNKPTMRVELGDLASFIVTSTGTVTGSGTTNTLPIWVDGPNGELGDSNISSNAGGIFIDDKLVVEDDTQFNTSVRISDSLAIDYPVGFPNVSQSHLGAFFAFQVNKPTPGSTDTRRNGVVHIGKGSNGNFTEFDYTLNLYTPSDFSDTTNFSDAKAFRYQWNDAYTFIRLQAEDYGAGNIAPLWEIGDLSGETTSARWMVNSGGFAKYSDITKDYFIVTNASSMFNVPLELGDALIDGSGSTGTAGQVLSSTGSVTAWTDIADISGSVTGSGTTNTLPIWTDGPNGVLGDSIITYDNTTVPTLTIGPQPSRLTIDGDLGVNNRATFNGPYARFNGQIEDGAGSPGTAGQVLTSTGAAVAWDDATDVVSGAIAKLIPFNITASPGGSSAYNADNNIVEISWTTGNGTYVLFLPTATGSNAYRNIRFVTNGTFPGGASHKIEITALPGETVDGAAFFEISKTYEGVSLWSNGTEWIVIQAKAH